MNEISGDDFVSTFGTRAIAVSDALDLRIEQAIYLISYKGRFAEVLRGLGLEALFVLLGDSDASSRLEEKFGFRVLDFHREWACCLQSRARQSARLLRGNTQDSCQPDKARLKAS